jgi:hypothetical protein
MDEIKVQLPVDASDRHHLVIVLHKTRFEQRGKTFEHAEVRS